MMGADRSRLPAVGPDPAFTFPSIRHHVLGNGLRIRTIQHDAMPIVSFVLQVAGGSSGDATGFEGLGALTADMVDEGTGGLSAIDVSEALDRIGAAYDVDVAPDATTFSLTTLVRFATRGAGLLADLIGDPILRAADFERVRQLRLDRLRQMVDVPPAVAERAFLRLLYHDHPYAHLPIGTDAALRRLSLRDVVACHRASYQPSRAVLVVAGPLPHDELAALGGGAFAGWADTGPAPGAEDTIAPLDAIAGGPRLAIVPREGAAQSELRIGQLATSRMTPDYPALVMLNAVLGGQFVSRINLKLREEKGFTYGARTGFDWRRGISPFVLQASVHTAATAEAIADAIDEIEAIGGRRPPSAEEIALARASLTRGYPRNFETVQQVARSVAQLALYELPDSYFETFVPAIQGVTVDAIVEAARRYLDPSRLLTLVVGDHAVIGDALSTLGLGEARILPAST